MVSRLLGKLEARRQRIGGAASARTAPAAPTSPSPARLRISRRFMSLFLVVLTDSGHSAQVMDRSQTIYGKGGTERNFSDSCWRPLYCGHPAWLPAAPCWRATSAARGPRRV